MKWIASLMFLLSLEAQADILFVNLNGQDAEANMCREGMLNQDPSQQLHVVKGIPGKDDRTGLSNSYVAVRAAVAKALSEGRVIDSIVISGDHGTGRFFGDMGFFTSEDFRVLRYEFPDFRVSSAALWGCYTTTVKSCEAHWLQNLEGMNFVMGFDGQAPLWSAEAGQKFLKAYCQTRTQISGQISSNDLCRFRDQVSALVNTTTHLGICSRTTVASEYYGCKTYEELQAMCPNFLNNRELQDVYMRYAQGVVEAPANTEPGSDYTAAYGQFDPKLRETCTRRDVHPLRCYYNQLHFWQHCERGNDMPDIRETLSLIKYQQIKARAQQNNQPALQSFDRKLQEVGLQNFVLGDITQLTRQQLNQRIETVKTQINNNVTDRRTRATLYRMSQCMEQTFTNLKNSCIPDEWHVTNQMPAASPCLETFEQASGKRGNETCQSN